MMSKQVEVYMTVTVPDVNATDEQIKAWIEFETGCNGMIKNDNPLSDYDMEADYVTVS